MALQVNKSFTLDSGVVVESYYMRIAYTVAHDNLEMGLEMQLYKNKQAYKDGFAPINKGFYLSGSIENGLDYMTNAHQLAKNFLISNGVGANDIVVVDI